MAKDKIRVRYAPSPTGHLHIGNARTALFNYLFARHNKGTFVLRIEDTDTKRNIADGERSQMENLHWLGIDWDEGPDKPGEYGPYRQSERKGIYQPLIQELLDKDLAYESFMTEDELNEQREAQKARGEAPRYEYEYEGMTKEEIKAKQDEARAKGLKPVVRIRVPKNVVYEWDDIVKGHVSFNSDTIGGDFVIQKRDGMPTYNFAVVVDDHMMKITHVLRGDDHVANTPKQLAVTRHLAGKPLYLAICRLSSIRKQARNFQNVMNPCFSLLNSIVRLDICLKRCSTSLLFLAGRRLANQKSSVKKISSRCLIRSV